MTVSGSVGAPGAPGTPARVDLHAHTTASDGMAGPEQFVAAAVAAGLSAVAVTDHDTVAAVAEVRRLAAGRAIRIVAGVELSVHDDAGDEIHLLGLHIAELARVERALASVREARMARAMEMVAKLNAIGVALEPDAVLDQAAGAAVGRPHVARALVLHGFVQTAQQAFDRWLGAGRPAYVEKQRLSVAAGIAIVHEAGGLAIYAHPGPRGTRERIEPLAALGLDGVEVRHPSHSAADMKRIRGIVGALGLVPSGGSDWHGASEGSRVLGCMQVTAEWLDQQVERVSVQEV